MAGDLKNVIVFTLEGARSAAELRWVREVISLGFVTSVPTAPPGIAGAFNLRGHLVPVLDIAALTRTGVGTTPRQGDSALLVEIDGVQAALRADKVEEVATLPSVDGTTIVDGRGHAVPLIDPAALVRRAIADANAVRGGDDEQAAPTPRDPTTGARVRLAFDGDTTLG